MEFVTLELSGTEDDAFYKKCYKEWKEGTEK